MILLYLETRLLQGIDPIKDQTLFLAQISQKALQRTMFPIGGMMKSKVKAIAQEAGLERISKKKEVGIPLRIKFQLRMSFIA